MYESELADAKSVEEYENIEDGDDTYREVEILY